MHGENRGIAPEKALQTGGSCLPRVRCAVSYVVLVPLTGRISDYCICFSLSRSDRAPARARLQTEKSSCRLPDARPSLDETLDGGTVPIACRDPFRVLIRNSNLADFNCHLGLSLRGDNPNDRGDALQPPRREQRMSREIYHDTNYVMRCQSLGDLRGIKPHEDSRSADVDYGPGKCNILRRDRAHTAAQPQAETASSPPFSWTG